MEQPLFEQHAGKTIGVVTSTFGERGQQYGDTWRDCQWLTLKAVSRKYGVDIPEYAVRALALAALCDVKYQRQQGGYKEDSVVDGIAYGLVMVEEIKQADIAHAKAQGIH